MSTDLADFDLNPDPRILPMLGEINLRQWRCFAELIDNSLDGFLAAARDGIPIEEPEVIVNIPTSDVESARVTVRDNGNGMTPEILEHAVKAGWTGNSPIGNLGMFGMGFNIATARLGTVTTVWTARPGEREWHGLQIDFDKLRQQRHFRTPHLTRPKSDPDERGTEITIERIKPEQRAWLVKPANISRVRKELSRAYAAMLRSNGVPLSFSLKVNGRKIPPKNHCTWSDERLVETSRWGTIPAVFMIDRRLPNRPFCKTCWQWLASGETVCPSCKTPDGVVARERHVHGWIGLQRYLSTSEYGLDFIRNGRKIEIANKDLFDWGNSDAVEREYPIDDPRNRGRFVGEIHLDHCRVSYTKDRFDRSDPAWEEMAEIVRGRGPLRPEKAAAAGYGNNESPLFQLYQAFRRSSPPNARLAGGWAKVLVVKDNDRAEEMAKLFHKQTPEYQDDTRWWELVEEQDNKLLTPTGSGVGSGTTTPGGGIPGFGGGTGIEGPDGPDTGAGPTDGIGTSGTPEPASVPPRTPIPSLTREYRHDGTSLWWDVRAFSVDRSDPALGDGGPPWHMTRRNTGEEDFFINAAHPVFQSATMTELDALLCQLAWSAVDLSKNQADAPTFASVLADFRDRYAGTLKLDPVALKGQADLLLAAIAKTWLKHVDPTDCLSLFNEEMTSAEQDGIYKRMAVRSVSNPQDQIARGRFLEYVSPRTLVSFVVAHPELFFDGRCWEDAYSELEFPRPAATEEARSRVVRHYESLLLDVLWLSEQEPEDLAIAPRERLLRAALAMDLLVPVASNEGGDE